VPEDEIISQRPIIITNQHYKVTDNLVITILLLSLQRENNYYRITIYQF